MMDAEEYVHSNAKVRILDSRVIDRCSDQGVQPRRPNAAREVQALRRNHVRYIQHRL